MTGSVIARNDPYDAIAAMVYITLDGTFGGSWLMVNQRAAKWLFVALWLTRMVN